MSYIISYYQIENFVTSTIFVGMTDEKIIQKYLTVLICIYVGCGAHLCGHRLECSYDGHPYCSLIPTEIC